MALTVTHSFVSAVPDGASPTRVKPSNWNDAHAVAGTLDISNGGTNNTTYTSNSPIYYDGTKLDSMSGVSWSSGALIVNTSVAIAANNPILDLTQAWNNAGVSFTGVVLSFSGPSGVASRLFTAKFGANNVFSFNKDGRIYFEFSNVILNPAGGRIQIVNAAVTDFAPIDAQQVNSQCLTDISVDTPAYSGSQTWNGSSVVFKVSTFDITDTISSTDSMLADWRVGSSTKFGVDKNGNLRLGKTVRAMAGSFGNLPVSPVTGMLATITDSSVSTWGSIIGGTGATTVLGFYNGANWTVAGT